MLYYRGPGSNPKPSCISQNRAKILIAGSLGAYFLACVWLLNVPTEGFGLLEAPGWLLIVTSLICAGMVLTSTWQRIAAEDETQLDERELALQNRANTFSFRTFTGCALISIIYCAIASDRGFWIPSSYDHYNAIFWAIFLSATLLPTAYIVWTQKEIHGSDE